MPGLDSECEERLTRWTLGAQSALERGGVLPPFSTAVTDTPEGTDSALESDLSERGRLEPGGVALGVTEGGQTAGNRGTSLCTYCRRALEDSAGGSTVDSLWACISCPHGEQVHASCMLDRAERLASGHADPQPCVTCRSEWPERNRPPHPAEMVEDLPTPLLGGRWPAVEGAPQFAELIREDGAAAGKLRDDWLPRNFRADGENPWEEPNFLVLAVLLVQRCSYPTPKLSLIHI